MSEVPVVVEVYRRIVDCRDLDISGSTHPGCDLSLRDATPRSPKRLQQASSTPFQAQVKLELGHHATLRLKPTFEGFTHDWEVFLRSPEGSSNRQIQHVIKRVEFHLHDSFSRQKIVKKEPPFMLNESGYAGFLFPIDVYFRNQGHPKRIRFLYDLILDRRRSATHIRCEKLTFRNPPEPFRSLLIKGGGQLVLRRSQLNDTGLGSSLCRSLDLKPCLQSSGIELSPTEPTVDSKQWFKVKQEVPDTPEQLIQDKDALRGNAVKLCIGIKLCHFCDRRMSANVHFSEQENQPQGCSNHSKSSVSFLQDWLRNIRSSKLAKSGGLGVERDLSCMVTSSGRDRTPFSSGIFSSDSWIFEETGFRSGTGRSSSCNVEPKRARSGVSESESWMSERKVTGIGIGGAGHKGLGGKGRSGERRGLRELEQVNGIWKGSVSSVTQSFAIELKEAKKGTDTSKMPPVRSRKTYSRRGRPPTKFRKFVPVAASGPSSVSTPQMALQQSAPTTNKNFKTKPDILESIIRRRLLKVRSHGLQTNLQSERPPVRFTSASGAWSQINHCVAPQTSKDIPPSIGILSPVRIQRRGPGRPRKNPHLPRPEKPAPGKRKRGRPARIGPAARTRKASSTRENVLVNSQRHLQPEAPNFSDDDDVVFLGYSPPKQEPQNDADYGFADPVSVDLGTASSHAWSRSVGRPRGVGRKRSTQLELLKSATDELVGNAGSSGLHTKESVRSESSRSAVQPCGTGKRTVGRQTDRGSDSAAPLSKWSEREDDWMEHGYRRKKPRIVPLRCGSDNEDDEDTGVSDLSVEYPSDIYRSSTPVRSSNYINKIERPAQSWMTSTPMKLKPLAVRQRSGTGQAAKRRNKEDVAWSRSRQNGRNSKRGRPRKVARTATLPQQLDDLESVHTLVPSSDPTGSPEVVTISGEPLAVLMDLQQRLATLADAQLLKRVVQIVEESGTYRLDDAMFDFDLCNLDRPTIEKLKGCLRQTSSPKRTKRRQEFV